MVVTRKREGSVTTESTDVPDSSSGDGDGLTGLRRSSRRSEGPKLNSVTDAEEAPGTPNRRKSTKVAELKASTAAGAVSSTPESSPVRRSRRLSGSQQPSTLVADASVGVNSPATSRTRRISELSSTTDATADKRPSTPTRSGRKRLSESSVTENDATSELEPTILASTAKKSALSASIKAETATSSPRPRTPVRKSRRLSGCLDTVPEIPTDNAGALESVPEVAETKSSPKLLKGALTAEKSLVEEDSKQTELMKPTKSPVSKNLSETIKTISDCKPNDHKNVTDIISTTEDPESDAKLVQNLMTSIKDSDSDNNLTEKSAAKASVVTDPLEKLTKLMINQIPKQKPKSGRFWKDSRSQFRQIKKDRGQRKTFEQRMKQKEERQQAKELADMLIRNKIEKKQELRARIEENKKRKEERERKAEIFQIVKNPNKIKRLKKRDLAKRDILQKVQRV